MFGQGPLPVFVFGAFWLGVVVLGDVVVVCGVVVVLVALGVVVVVDGAAAAPAMPTAAPPTARVPATIAALILLEICMLVSAFLLGMCCWYW